MASWTVKLSDKDLVVFDLDGTLTATKSNLAPDMASALAGLLAEKRVAVIGGGSWVQFKKQFLRELRVPRGLFRRLFLFPTTATRFYRYRSAGERSRDSRSALGGGWREVYRFELPKSERALIRKAFRDVLREIRYVAPKRTYGKVIEDRGSQVTFSALGQDIVARLGARGVRMKEEWTRKNTPVKLKIAELLQKRLPGLEVHASGYTSIDVTRNGIDKEYGVRQISKYLRVPISKMVFVGDALFPGGNDYAARRSGVECIPVRGPEDTEKVIRKILKDC